MPRSDLGTRRATLAQWEWPDANSVVFNNHNRIREGFRREFEKTVKSILDCADCCRSEAEHHYARRHRDVSESKQAGKI